MCSCLCGCKGRARSGGGRGCSLTLSSVAARGVCGVDLGVSVWHGSRILIFLPRLQGRSLAERMGIRYVVDTFPIRYSQRPAAARGSVESHQYWKPQDKLLTPVPRSSPAGRWVEGREEAGGSGHHRSYVSCRWEQWTAVVVLDLRVCISGRLYLMGVHRPPQSAHKFCPVKIEQCVSEVRRS